MDASIKAWLEGQIEALRRLTREVREAVDRHAPCAGAELRAVEVGCNCASRELTKQFEVEEKTRREER